MAFSTLYGTALLINQGMTAEEIKKRVATPGGITEEGKKLLRAKLPPVFDHLYDCTLTKHAFVRECIHQVQKDLSAQDSRLVL